MTAIPSVETLGYSRPSLRDTDRFVDRPNPSGIRQESPRAGGVSGCARAILAFLALAVIWVRMSAVAGEFFLFTSFRGNLGRDGLHLALSTNG